VRTQIERALDHTVQETTGASTARPAIDDGLFDVTIDPESCWIDYAIGRKR
jgi:hypothetical protein